MTCGRVKQKRISNNLFKSRIKVGEFRSTSEPDLQWSSTHNFNGSLIHRDGSQPAHHSVVRGTVGCFFVCGKAWTCTLTTCQTDTNMTYQYMNFFPVKCLYFTAKWFITKSAGQCFWIIWSTFHQQDKRIISIQLHRVKTLGLRVRLKLGIVEVG